jgi:hypothetical protein
VGHHQGPGKVFDRAGFFFVENSYDLNKEHFDRKDPVVQRQAVDLDSPEDFQYSQRGAHDVDQECVKQGNLASGGSER